MVPAACHDVAATDLARIIRPRCWPGDEQVTRVWPQGFQGSLQKVEATGLHGLLQSPMLLLTDVICDVARALNLSPKYPANTCLTDSFRGLFLPSVEPHDSFHGRHLRRGTHARPHRPSFTTSASCWAANSASASCWAAPASVTSRCARHLSQRRKNS